MKSSTEPVQSTGRAAAFREAGSHVHAPAQAAFFAPGTGFAATVIASGIPDNAPPLQASFHIVARGKRARNVAIPVYKKSDAAKPEDGSEIEIGSGVWVFESRNGRSLVAYYHDQDEEEAPNKRRAEGWVNSEYLTEQPIPKARTNMDWATSEGRLYSQRSRGPVKSDVRQGNLADCFFLAPLAAIAGTPSGKALIKRTLRKNEDDTFTTSFHQTDDDMRLRGREYITVDRSMPVTDRGTYLYNQQGADPSDSSVAIWASVMEKAYAKWDEDEGYKGMDMENASRAILHLTGLEPESLRWDIDSGEEHALEDGWEDDTFHQEILEDAEGGDERPRAPKDITADTLKKLLRAAKMKPDIILVAESNNVSNDDSNYLDPERTILDSHVYVIDEVSKGGQIKLYDPRGDYVTITVARFRQYFNRVLKANMAEAF